MYVALKSNAVNWCMIVWCATATVTAMCNSYSALTISMPVQNALCKGTATYSESPTTRAIAAHSVTESGSAQNCEALWVHWR